MQDGLSKVGCNKIPKRRIFETNFHLSGSYTSIHQTFFRPQCSLPLHPTAWTFAHFLLSWDSPSLLLQIRSSYPDSPNTWFTPWREGCYIYIPYTNSLPRVEWRIQKALTYLLQMLAKTDGTVFDSTNEYNSKVCQTQSNYLFTFHTLKSWTTP